DGQPDPDVTRVDLDGVAADARPLFELDEDDGERVVPSGNLRTVVHDEAVDLATSGGDDIVLVQRIALRAHRTRRMTERAARAAALDAELVGGDALPEEG